MSETATRPEPAAAFDVLTALILAFVTPMFISVAGGDIALARSAALATIADFRAGTKADLISIAQIIACGLAALASLSLSMHEDISVSMALRLRGNAVSLNRAAERSRQTLGQPSSHATEPDVHTKEDQRREAEVLAKTAEFQEEAACGQGTAPTQNPQPAAQFQSILAAAMTDGAAELTAKLDTLPREERWKAKRRIEALKINAQDLLTGKSVFVKP